MSVPLAPYLAPANCAPSGAELLAPDGAHFFKSGAVNPKLHALGHDVPTAARDVLPGGPAAHTFCRTKIRDILTTGNVDSYLTATTIAGQPILRTPLILLQTHIDAQAHPFARDFLPRGYPESSQAQLLLLNIMRVLLKHDQGFLCAVLLTNIVELNRRCIRENVPHLRDLIIKQLPKVIIAEYIFHPNRTSPLTTWEVIDRRLQDVRTQLRAFQHMFATLVVQKDQEAFNGSQMIFKIDKNIIHVPTDDKVRAAMVA
ncbi:hypothetical protein PCANC_00935 [Puccinia coronata f. sp. avenae]|uniref:Uncharacterized protein n=1 Tax=Puccinia coronata f. sp. avenae TaxID=200324 RepID=A0A2N5W6L8_9BASI|nr:hypothetical protein PCANC_00935 [Puccinia coronata f. sp. avenae]